MRDDSVDFVRNADFPFAALKACEIENFRNTLISRVHNQRQRINLRMRFLPARNIIAYGFLNPRALIGIFIILFFAAVAIFAPQLATANPKSIEFFPWEKPSGEHILGTNSYGQDVFSQVVYGARVTLLVGILAGVLTSLIGTAVGRIAG